MPEGEPLTEAYLLIGGPQGAGLETSAQVLSAAYAYTGYGVIANREYHSNIIGRHSYVAFTVAADSLPRHYSYPFHVAAFMDAESVFTHYSDLGPGSVLVYDTGVERTRIDQVVSMRHDTRSRLLREYRERGIEPTVQGVVSYLRSQGVRVAGLDYKALLSRLQERYGVPRGLVRRYLSAIVAGAVAGLTGLEPEALRQGFSYRFRGRERLVEPNMYIAGLAAGEAREKAGTVIRLAEPSLGHEEFFVVSGNDVVAMAKVVGGVRFQSYYPITPAQDESFYLESHERLAADGEELGSVVVLQTEDELAAIAAAIGASLAGARASTATSGPGYDLMVEGLSWAWINEVPLLLTLYQRAGPSTGLPTRGSQEDLFAALFAAHGGVPRIVIASGDHEEAFHDTIKALNLAERYQVPVIHLLDKFLANSVVTLPPPRLEGLEIDRGKYVPRYTGEGPYKRFSLEEGPISPRAPIGGAVAWYTGDEHDEYGHITEEPETRMAMVEKRMAKIELADREIPEKGERARLYPTELKPSEIELLIVGWGTVKGVALRAVEELQGRGVNAAYLHLRYFTPFPAKYVYALIKGVKTSGGTVVAVEHNQQAQAARIIEMNTGLVLTKSIVKYTGRPIYLRELLDALERIRKGETERVVLRFGA